uniref:MARVEL domain-containing protein n=1 Tax=Canis lupus familiaris TaxID=9615 RepID=A0A8C0NL91_CANLF
MSHGAGLVRTTCSSSGGGGGGAGQPGARASEGPLDPVYPRTYSALLKVAQMITLLIAFICVNRSMWTSYAYSYFEVVTICNLIMILVFYLVHLFRLYRMLTCISWPLSELLHYLIGTLLLLIASIVAASKSYSQSGLVAGAIFGFVATFLCLASIWMSYKISCVTQSTGSLASQPLGEEDTKHMKQAARTCCGLGVLGKPGFLHPCTTNTKPGNESGDEATTPMTFLQIAGFSN